MVLYGEVQASNRQITDATAPQVAVFIGGTSGIGKLTVQALVSTGASVRIYLLGRKSSEDRVASWIGDLRTTKPRAEIIWIECEASLLADVKRACDVVACKEARIDLLFLTAGYAPLGSRKLTPEGIEIAQSLEYYSRMLSIQLLLKPLKSAPHARVVSVLSGGLERTGSLNLDDLDLAGPGSFSIVRAQTQYGVMGSMALDKLAEDHPEVTFIHSWPGVVNTGGVDRGVDAGSLMSWFVWAVVKPIIALFACSDVEAGQRHLFQATSGVFGGEGTAWSGRPGINALGKSGNGGLFLVDRKCECTPNEKVIPILREKAREKVWAHTQQRLMKYLS